MKKPTGSSRTFRRRPFNSTPQDPTTDAEKRAILGAGKPLEFPPAVSGQAETQEARAARTIRASWLTELLSPSDRVCNLDIRIRNAIIEGPLNMEYGSFNGLVYILDCELAEAVDFSVATFNKGVNFSGSTFNARADFAGCQARHNFTMERSVFRKGATFLDLYVDGLLIAAGARFDQVSFERLRVTKSAFFRTIRQNNKLYRTRFMKEASFLDANIEGRAEFDGATFKGHANFSFMRVAGSALFRSALLGATDQDGTLALIPTLFLRGASFLSARFLGVADFTGAQFAQRSSFRNFCAGADLFFHSVIYEQKVRRTVFGDSVDFSGLQVEGAANFDGVLFVGEAIFARSHFKGDASFATFFSAGGFRKAEFHQWVDFSDSHFDANLGCDGAQFGDGLTFARARIDGNAHFQPVRSLDEVTTARFGGLARFEKVQIQGSLECECAQFEGDSTFELLQVGGIVLLRAAILDDQIIPIRFVGNSTFLEAKFHGADFAGAQFEGSAIFSRVSFDGPAFFGALRTGGKALVTRFGSYADFVEARVQGRSEFIETEFHDFANFSRINMQASSTFVDAHFSKEVSFQGARFMQSVSFENAAFIKPADLSRMRVDASALFQMANFSNKVDLRDSYISTIFFRDELVEDKSETRKTQFATVVDIRGLSYERIHADWDKVMEAMDPYDRQPYVSLERFFRTIGRDRQAELVYLKRRHVERKRLANLAQRSRYASQWLQWVLFNYGVRPFRLLGFSFVIVLVGVFMFTRPGAVRDKDAKETIQARQRVEGPALAPASSLAAVRSNEPSGQIADEPPEIADLKWPQALGVSLRLFIPIVEVPTGSRWVPSENEAPFLRHVNLSFAGYATLHRLAGAILVPLGIAALTGLLYRKDK